jgi:hypothetical protein
MTRMSKKGKRRAVSPRKHKIPSIKSGPKRDQLSFGYKPLENAVEDKGLAVFIGKVK